MSIKDRRFKNVFVYQRFHKKLIAFLVLANLSISFSVYFFARHFMNNLVYKGIELGIPKYHAVYEYIGVINEQMTYTIIACVVCSSLVLIIGTYIIAHRVSGPLFRLSSHLDKLIENGELEEVHFRQNDYLLDVEEKFNNFIKVTRKKVEHSPLRRRF